MKKRWDIAYKEPLERYDPEMIIDILLRNRGVFNKDAFLSPMHPLDFSSSDFGIDNSQLLEGVKRIKVAIQKKESIVVYADYDADGVTAGAIMWEAIHNLGGKVMPYIPHRVEEGYGLSHIGIDAIKRLYDVDLIVTVDHGITAKEKVEYAASLGIDVLITDHHAKPEDLPDTTIIHTTKTSGAGVAWFVAKHLLSDTLDDTSFRFVMNDFLTLASLGIVADLLPLIDINRSFVVHGLPLIAKSSRPGIQAMLVESGIHTADIGPYHISYIIAPRLNALGRLDHAMDALRLLCTKDKRRSHELAKRLGTINKERQDMTLETTNDAVDKVRSMNEDKKVLILADEKYNPGIIGLAAGKLVETFYRPSIVIAKGETVSKASARSIPGFNIIEGLREARSLFLELGGHPMAAGFSIETSKISAFQEFFEEYVQRFLSDELCIPSLAIDMELPMRYVTKELYQAIQQLAPFGVGNPSPIFCSRNVHVRDMKQVGADGKHLKFKISHDKSDRPLNAIWFEMGKQIRAPGIQESIRSIAYSIEETEWENSTSLEVKVKDMI